jgi:hypothetical protein
MDELKRMPKKLDVSTWNYGMIELMKESVGLSANSCVIGIDPGTMNIN